MDDDYAEAVLDLVAAIPPGRAMTYGTIAEIVGDLLEARDGARRGGPRQVGQVMGRAGSGVPWWRVVNAAGSPPPRHTTRALALLGEEGTPLTADGTRVALRRAIWFPDED
ncbi:MGMT family protein [Cellulomonas sp. P5_C5]